MASGSIACKPIPGGRGGGVVALELGEELVAGGGGGGRLPAAGAGFDGAEGAGTAAGASPPHLG
ncbi:MAG TPA: hypothetical protein VEU32_15030 [Burkholderiales bacterium]|nr:hypothetical protein [Burkholderiales bacterium]